MTEPTPPRSTTPPAIAYGLLAVAAVVAAVVYDASPPSLVGLAVFSALALWAENGGVRLPSAVTISPSLMVVMAAIAALHPDGVVVGAAIVGAANGVRLALVRGRQIAWLVINSGQYLVSAVVAAFTFVALPNVPTALGVLATCVAFGIVNVTLVIVAAVVIYRAKAREVWAEMRVSLPGYLAFGALGALVGELYDTLGPLAVVLLLTPIVIARATFSSALELGKAHEATIAVFLRAIAAKDEYTAKHTERVCAYSMYIGEKLGFSRARLEHLRHAALMHDIGKLAVPKHLLNKPGKLTDEEFRRVQKHAHVCIDILDLVDFLKPMTAAAAGHHARFDGGGYGGRESDRPLEAYIVAVADAYDAMTSTRSYRRALPMEVAFEELRGKSGSQFHPDCVEGLIAAITERGERHGFGHEVDAVAFDVPPPVMGVGSAGLGDRERPATELTQRAEAEAEA